MPINWADHELEADSSGGAPPFVGRPVDAYFTTEHVEPTDRAPFDSTKLHIKLARSEPELYPTQKPEISWSWNTGPGWTASTDGTTISHEDPAKNVNANTDLGKMLKAMRAVDGLADVLDDFQPTSGKWYAALPEMEWSWTEEPRMMPDPAAPAGTRKFIPNPDPTKVTRRLIPVRLISAGTASPNGQPPVTFDLATLGLSDVELGHFEEAAKGAKDRNELLAALTRVPGAMTPAVMAALSDEATGEAMRVALGGTF